MKLIVWTPKTRHGKNLVQQHGKTWEVIGENETQYYVKSLCFTLRVKDNYEKDVRWIDKTECEDWTA